LGGDGVGSHDRRVFSQIRIICYICGVGLKLIESSHKKLIFFLIRSACKNPLRVVSRMLGRGVCSLGAVISKVDITGCIFIERTIYKNTLENIFFYFEFLCQ
jgi:hypothetical protein